MKETILIIGASGSIGLEVANRLIEKEKHVRIAVRDPEKAKKLKLNNSDFVHFEYTKEETFKPAFEKVKKILLVSPPSFLNIHKQVNKAIDDAIKEKVKLIVNISAMGTENDTKDPMCIIENHIINSGIDYVLLRPNCYMQNFKDLFRDFIKDDDEISAPAEDTKTSFVDLRDVADFAVQALLKANLKNKSYTLTGSQALNMHVISFLFTEALNREINYRKISEEKFKKILQGSGWSQVTIEGTMQLCNYIKGNSNSQITDDIKKVLKREPIKFQKFIMDNLKNWK
ncbi:MAG: NmrA family NAD(P)-binding protein [Ignavibacteriales bacterium]|nr:NmrA family NAD(P)-binding protein [Ignavibacteriota bacterium]MCB9248538.1 NmrA family NAD(P)-binding protein [Ignavibacteriales bacterium]